MDKSIERMLNNMTLKVYSHNDSYYIPDIKKFKGREKFKYERATLRFNLSDSLSLNPYINPLVISGESNHIKWIELTYYGFINDDPNGLYIDEIKRNLKNGLIRIKKEKQMKNLIYLSEEGRRIFTFIFDGMIIKLLPPLYGLDMNLTKYTTYELCTYINGVLLDKLDPNSEDYKKFNFDTNGSTKEQRDFRDAWRYLLKLNRRECLTEDTKQEIEKTLLNHIVAIESEAKYARVYEINFDHADYSIHTNTVFDVNKKRVELGIKFRTPGIIQKINYIKLII